MLFLLLILILLALFVLIYFLTSFTGGWFAPTPNRIIKEMLDLAEVGKKDVLIDLGSGDGKVLLLSAKRGASAIGIELNPFLYLWSLIRIKLIRPEPSISLKFGNFWTIDLSNANVVFSFLPFGSARLKKKLKDELKQGSWIICYGSSLPNWKPIKVTDSGIFLYRV